MSLEKLALLGIVLFVIIAMVQTYSATRTIRRSMRRKGPKPRRPVSSEVAAMEIARGLVHEAVQSHPALIEKAQAKGRIIPELEALLEEPMMHYRERVMPRFKPLFYDAANEVILGKSDTDAADRVNLSD